MTTISFFIAIVLTLLIISLLSSESYCSNDENSFRFFQVENYLFAGNNTHYWHVFSSEADETGSGENLSRAGAIRFNMVGPHRLMEEEASDAPREGPKFIFVARLQESCTLLVFVDSALNYRLWRIRIRVSTNLSEAITSFMAPFHLHKLLNSDCDQTSKMPEAAHLSMLPFFAGFFNNNQTSAISSVFSSEHGSVLHVLFSDSGESNFHYGSVHLNQSDRHWSSSSSARAKPIAAPTSKLLKGKIAALYTREGTHKQFMLLQHYNDTRVCLVTSLTPSLVMKGACKTITTYYSYDKQQKLGRGIELVGSDDHHSNGTTSAEKVCVLR